VAGSFVSMGRMVEITVRLIHAETGEILSAYQKRFKRQWYAQAGSISEPASMTPLQAVSDILAFQRGIAQAGVEEDDCTNAADRIDRWEASVLGLKARYWARELKKAGFSAGRLKTKPGAVIQDTRLRRRFHRLLEGFMRIGAPPLTASETRRFIDADSKAFMLHIKCTFTAKKPKGGSL